MTRFAVPLFMGLVVFAVGVQANSVLYTERLADNIYALVGPTGNRDPQNLGNNANFGADRPRGQL